MGISDWGRGKRYRREVWDMNAGQDRLWSYGNVGWELLLRMVGTAGIWHMSRP